MIQIKAANWGLVAFTVLLSLRGGTTKSSHPNRSVLLKPTCNSYSFLFLHAQSTSYKLAGIERKTANRGVAAFIFNVPHMNSCRLRDISLSNHTELKAGANAPINH
ncbi:hypothetical protein DWB61_11330 [Ancylomarina euxinus]|uniref:Uncharacterized protein n=1 Tax=Ancylomarina euxinus TaxID=2283627 RepID=A0A425Y0G9_9BACT|nr:hypothetical protein DWB61_11330 [Ancylomarina euxinus]